MQGGREELKEEAVVPTDLAKEKKKIWHKFESPFEGSLLEPLPAPASCPPRCPPSAFPSPLPTLSCLHFTLCFLCRLLAVTSSQSHQCFNKNVGSSGLPAD